MATEAFESEPVPSVVYLAQGKLYLKEPGAPPRLVESAFAQGIIDRSAKARERNEWKGKGTFWNLGMLGDNPAAAAAEVMANARRVRFTGVTRGAGPAELLYALDTDTVGGLFAFDVEANHERRLFHRNLFRARDLSRRPADGMLAFAVESPDGSSHIALMEAEGRGFREVTEGDSVDEAPAWVGPEGKALVFQSAGVGRNAAGVRVAVGPYAVQKLDLDDGGMVTLLEAEDRDYLLPKVGGDGSLYFVRRPYQPAGPAASPLKVAGDILLFPFRLAVALVHFLNFFSLLFARKPLITSGGPPKEGPDARYLMLFGKVIDAEKALRESGKSNAGIVPGTWELVRRAVDGRETVLARGVVSFDLCRDGGVVYTNGSGVFHLGPGGVTSELCYGKMIEQLSAVR